jgi:anti-anti-sigma factor
MSIYAQDQMRLSITRPPGSFVDCVQIQGDVDLRDCRALGLAARELIDGDASTIYVDLGNVNFVGSILVGFLVQVGDAPGRARRHLVLCRPTSMARKVIHLTGLELFASVHPELPEPWPDIAAVDSAAPRSARTTTIIGRTVGGASTEKADSSGDDDDREHDG